MYIALAHDHYDDNHLADVIAQMQTMGAPTIRSVYMDCYDCYVALEGCHRIRAAKLLGLTPIIDAVEYDDIKDQLMCDNGFDADATETFETFLDGANKRTIIEF